MREFIGEAIGGPPARVDLEQALAQLSGKTPLAAAATIFDIATKATLPSIETLNASWNAENEKLALIDNQLSLKDEDLGAANEISNVNEAFGVETIAAEVQEEILAIAPDAHTLALTQGEEAVIAAPDTTLLEAPREDSRLQTMRVPPAKLDALMNLASELTVTGTRVLRGLAVFSEIGALWEEWQKDTASQRHLRAVTGNDPSKSSEVSAFEARNEARLARLGVLWETLQATAYQDLTRLNFVADELEMGIRGVRLLPLSQVFGLFPRLVRDLARELDKEVDFSIQGGEIAADKRILEEIKDPLMHMLRNSLDHGIERPEEREKLGKPRVAQLQLRARQNANSVSIELKDDGRGIDLAAIKRTALQRRLHTSAELDLMSVSQLHNLIFAPGFSTSNIVTDVSGRGVGMDVVRTNIERLKGSIEVVSEPGTGTTFSIRLPSTLATTRVLLVSVEGRSFALPIEWIKTITSVPREQIFSLEGRPHFLLAGRAVPLSELAVLLQLESKKNSVTTGVTVVLEVSDVCFGVGVDHLIDEQEVMLKPLGALLKRVRNVSGVTILSAGELCMVLNVTDLAKSALKSAPSAQLLALPDAPAPRKVILLVEDSITTRTQEKRILESAGFEVVTAVDGADGFRKLETRAFDGVVSDVEMPNMDGLTLAARIRALPKYNEMPIVLVTSLSSDQDKQRGIDVGANAYLTKGAFEQKALIETLRRLV
jgi:two-component system chemotaxis sensor kinase CheA